MPIIRRLMRQKLITMNETPISQPSTIQSWLKDIYATRLQNKSELGYTVESVKGSTKIDTVANLVALRLLKNYDGVCAITGFEGVGKSSFSILIGRKLARRTNTHFDLETNVLYDPTYEQVIKVVQTIPERSTVIIDEAIKIAYARNWGKKEQKQLNIIFTTIRERKLFVLMNIPAFTELDSFFKSFRILLWFHIFARGKAGLFVKDPNPFNTDPFNLKIANRILQDMKANERFNLSNLISRLRNSVPNFLTWFYIPELPSDIYLKYDALKKKYNFEVPQMQRDATAQLKETVDKSIMALYESSDVWDYKKLASAFNVSEKYVRTIINKARKQSSQEDAEAEPDRQEPDASQENQKADTNE